MCSPMQFKIACKHAFDDKVRKANIFISFMTELDLNAHLYCNHCNS